jgi:DNA-directed RNA polymerase specialized sigma24 family protein
MVGGMCDITRILSAIESGDPHAADQLLPLVYDEMRTLSQLAATDSQAAELVKLRYFAGFTTGQAAEVLGVSPRTADFLWAYARSWLVAKIEGDNAPSPSGAADPSRKK